MKNEVTITMDAVSQNESFARLVVSAFIAPLDPTVSEMTDVKTAVSEAVTNAIIHGYEGKEGKINLICKMAGEDVTIEVLDDGCGIEDVEQAMEPLYTSKQELERSGMGFTVMQTFMDSVVVRSTHGEGTHVIMTKKISVLSTE